MFLQKLPGIQITVAEAEYPVVLLGAAVIGPQLSLLHKSHNVRILIGLVLDRPVRDTQVKPLLVRSVFSPSNSSSAISHKIQSDAFWTDRSASGKNPSPAEGQKDCLLP